MRRGARSMLQDVQDVTNFFELGVSA